MWQSEMTGDEIAHALGFSGRGAVYSAVARLKLQARKKRYPNRISGYDADKIIRELWDSELELSEIAFRLNWRWGQSISKRAKELGLPNRRTGQSRD